MAADNVTLGKFNLEGIPPAPRGVPQIDVTFDIDANGILNVSARDKATNQQQEITITATTNLTESEVEELVKEAKRHEAEDRRRKELVEARNAADQIVYQMEKTLGDLGDQISESDRGRIQQIIGDLKEAKQGDDASRIRSLIEQLQQASQAIGQQMYAQQAAAHQAGPGAGPQAGSSPEGGDEEDVVEGDFREV
jgi:molecular chaperone DnaK